jgi:AI-2 transport protein TqsA
MPRMTGVPPPLPSITPRLVAGAAGVVILFGLHAVASLVVLSLLSILATLLLAPLQAGLRRRGVPGWAALLLALVTYIGVLAVAGLTLAIGLTGFVRDLPAYRDELEALLLEVGVLLGGPGAPPAADADAIGAVLRAVIDDLVGTLSTVGYSMFIVAYLLLEAPRAEARVRHAFGPASDVPVRAAALGTRLRTYVVARAILGAVAAALDTVLLVVLGVPNALLWGVLSFLLSFIPNIGFILALIPPTVMGLLVGGLPLAIAVVIGYVVINVAIDYVVQPKFVGSSVDLAAVVVTVCLLFWAVVLGPSGALLAVPMTIIAAAAFDAFDETRPLARLLGQGPADGPVEDLPPVPSDTRR